VRNNKKVLAAAAAVGVFGALVASAATLGGLDSVQLGADQTVVTSCDSDGVGLAYTTAYDATSNAYKVTDVTMTDLEEGCFGSDFQLTLSDGTAVLVEATGKVATATQVVTLPAAVDAEAVSAAALTISG
jgi:hypothetical protein